MSISELQNENVKPRNFLQSTNLYFNLEKMYQLYNLRMVSIFAYSYIDCCFAQNGWYFMH